MAQDVLNNNLHVNGAITCSTFTAPAGSITNAAIQAAAGIDASKVVHQHQKHIGQAHGTAATDERRVIHLARGSGTVTEFLAGPVVAAVGDSTVTADLRKNGTTVLSAVLSIDSGDAAYATLTATVSSAAYVAGDVFEAVLDATVGTGTLPQGVWAQATFRENPQ